MCGGGTYFQKCRHNHQHHHHFWQIFTCVQSTDFLMTNTYRLGMVSARLTKKKNGIIHCVGENDKTLFPTMPFKKNPLKNYSAKFKST